MFTVEHREAVRRRLVIHARADPRITAAALVGSAAADAEDDWSDIDLALRLAPGADQAEVAAAIGELLANEHDVVDSLDVWSGATLFRVFLLADTLQIDVSFWHTADFRATGGPFRLLFGEAEDPAPLAGPTPAELAGLGWLHALHVRSALARQRPWQTAWMLDGLRDQIVALACRRHGLPAHQGRSTDRLPAELLAALEATRPSTLLPPDLARAFSAAADLLLEQVEQDDSELAARLGTAVSLLARPASVPPPLRTDRLRLRRWRATDAVWLHDLWAERDPRSARRLDADGRPTVDDLRADIVARLGATGPALLVVERLADGEPLGYCGLVVGHASEAEPELAYELFRHARGRGYATESARAVVDAATSAGLTRLWSTVRAWNAPSLRVLEKLGFVPSGRVDPDPVRGDSLWLVRDASVSV